MTDDEAKEAAYMIKWWSSRTAKRLRVMLAAGGFDLVRQETICHMLEYPPKVDITFSTWVLNSYHWRVCRLVHKESRQVNAEEYTDKPVECGLLRDVEGDDLRYGLWNIARRELDERSFMCLYRHCNGETLDEISKPFKISRERVRQLIVKAVRVLQRHSVAKRVYKAAGLRWFDGDAGFDSGSDSESDETCQQLDEGS